MRVTTVMLAQSIRLMDLSGFLAMIYLPDAAKLIGDRYGFLRVPKTLEELNSATTGADFHHGKFTIDTRTVRIERFQVFSNGLIAITRTDTDDANLFIDDVLNFASARFNAQVPEVPGPTCYLSHLEVELQIQLEEGFPSLKSIADKISESVGKYGLINPQARFQMTGLSFYIDTSNNPNTPVQPFTLERRVKKPFASNLYYSTAPLKTSEHRNILQHLELLFLQESAGA